MMSDLNRFLKAQEDTYVRALEEIKAGKKRSHWMWFIFPQIKGLGQSQVSKYYAIQNFEEAILYLENPLLKSRLLEISQALLALDVANIADVLGSIDTLKLKSSMTLFHMVDKEEKVFMEVLRKYFHNEFDHRTIEILEIEKGKKGKYDI